MRSLITFLLLAIICLGVVSCPKGHKSFGGSSSVANSVGGYDGSSDNLDNASSDSVDNSSGASDQSSESSSSSGGRSSGGGLFGGGLPEKPGAYVDVNADGNWTSDGVRKGNSLALMVGGSIMGPDSKQRLGSIDEFDRLAVTPSSGRLRYCFRAVSGEQVSGWEDGAHLYRLTRQDEDDRMMISDSAQVPEALKVSRPEKGNVYLVQINLPGPGDYAFASAWWTVYIHY